MMISINGFSPLPPSKEKSGAYQCCLGSTRDAEETPSISPLRGFTKTALHNYAHYEHICISYIVIF